MPECKHCTSKLSTGSLVFDSGLQYRVQICQRCERWYRVGRPVTVSRCKAWLNELYGKNAKGYRRNKP